MCAQGVETTAGDGDLEIGLRWDRRRGELHISLRLEVLDTNVDDWHSEDEPLRIDFDRLRRLLTNEPAYGAALTEMVLGRSDVQMFYRKARAAADVGARRLHVRLHISAPAGFHAIRWESLRDPETGAPLATQPNVLLSRYLSSPDWRPIPALARHDLRALIVVAAPADPRMQRPFGGGLADVDVDAEVARARRALADIPYVQELTGGSATLAGMLAALEDGIDVLYLVCHGALVDDLPRLYLEQPDRSADVVDGRKLVERLAELDRRPTVAMLCSCRSAGAGTEPSNTEQEALAALGPRLAEAGVATVVAMQGDVSMPTTEAFLPAFFSALARHGVVDAAAAAGRRAVRDRPDWWAPVLFSRLRTGRTYYLPEFAERGPDTWRTLELQIKTGNFTPVLGPDLATAILGSRQDIARRWVRRWQMPIAPANQGDLAQVAQYLRVRSAAGTVRAQLQDHLETEIEQRRRRATAADSVWRLPDGLPSSSNLQAAISAAGSRLREPDEGDPFRVMSALPVSVYVTTGWTNLLEDALTERGRPPLAMAFPWNTRTERAAVAFEEPTRARPLVYHLYGRLDDPGSLVVTEDDYFAWMNAWFRRRKSIPPAVSKALTARSLLFLGYSLDDWDFRVVFHSIKCFGGSSLLRENLHVGVQLAPENPMIEPEAAQEYLESYFGEDKVSIYWGETRQFLDELRRRTGLET
jgi:hypothetical protein